MTHPSPITEAFYTKGWVTLPQDPMLIDWLSHVTPVAKTIVTEPQNAHWLRCDNTWFVGVNSLPNDPTGAVAGSGPLRGQAIDLLAQLNLPQDQFDPAQLSVIYPGYPKPHAGESPAATRFRRDRDATHVDGLLPIGPERRRMLREPHAFVLGLPMTRTDPGASPLVVWEGSHQIIRAALKTRLDAIPPQDWPNTDLTEAYTAARREAFATCQRITVHANPGEAYLVHRLALHGVAPWQTGANAPPEGRMIAYFRPELSGAITDWLNLP